MPPPPGYLPPMPIPHSWQGPTLVTALSFVLWYALRFGLQRGTKYRLLAEYAAR